MKKIAIILTVVALAIAGALIFRQPSSHQETPLRQVTVNQAFEHLLYIGLYVAKDQGFFAEQGLDVNIETGGGDAQAFAALTSGKADFAQGDPAFVAIAGEKGWDGRVVAMAVDRVAIWGVTFNKSIVPFSNPEGFRGYTVATYPEPNTSYVVQKQLDNQAGLQLGKDTRILQVPFGTELATLKNNQADIAQTIEPNVSQVELQGGTVVFSYPEAWGPLAFTGLMTSQQLIESDPDLVQKVVNAYDESLRFIHDDFDATLDIAMNRLKGLDREVVKTALRRLIDSGCIPNQAKVDPESWRKLLEIRVDVGDLKEMPTKDWIDNTFADRAQEQ